MEKFDRKIYDDYPHIDEKRLFKSMAYIVNLKKKLSMEYSRIQNTISGSISISVSAKEKIQTKINLLEYVNKLNGGSAFGELSLISHEKRNATCYV